MSRATAPIVVFLLALSGSAFAQSVLHCYGMETQIGTVARRDFSDENGFIVKEIFYTSTEPTLRPSCAEGTLRVQSTRTYSRDRLGRALVETELRPDGSIEHVWKYEYRADEKQPARRILYGPRGNPRYEVRDGEGGEHSEVHFDEQGRVVGVNGAVRPDVESAIAWGPEIDGWSCGIALDPASASEPSRFVNVHLRNGTDRAASARFLDYFETKLRDSQGGIVPLTAKYLATAAARPDAWTERIVRPGEVAFYPHALTIRYGLLPPGRYTLVVRHPHPRTGAALTSGTVSFDIAPRRSPR